MKTFTNTPKTNFQQYYTSTAFNHATTTTTPTKHVETLNFSIAATNIINESIQKNKKFPDSTKNCTNSIFRKKKYNNLLDGNKIPLLLTPSPTSPTTTLQTLTSIDLNTQSSYTSPTRTAATTTTTLEPLASSSNNLQLTKMSTSTKNSLLTTATTINNDKAYEIQTEHNKDDAANGAIKKKTSIEKTLEYSKSFNYSDDDEDINGTIVIKKELTHASNGNASPTFPPPSLSPSSLFTTKTESCTSKGSNLNKKNLVVEKLKGTNSVITRKIFATTKKSMHENNSNGKNHSEEEKNVLKSQDSSDLVDDGATAAAETTAKDESDSDTINDSLLRTTTL